MGIASSRPVAASRVSLWRATPSWGLRGDLSPVACAASGESQLLTPFTLVFLWDAEKELGPKPWGRRAGCRGGHWHSEEVTGIRQTFSYPARPGPWKTCSGGRLVRGERSVVFFF